MIDVEKVRPLTMREVGQLRAMKDGNAANILCILLASGEDKESVEAWYDSAPAGEVQYVLDAIYKVSKLDDASRFRG